MSLPQGWPCGAASGRGALAVEVVGRARHGGLGRHLLLLLRHAVEQVRDVGADKADIGQLAIRQLLQLGHGATALQALGEAQGQAAEPAADPAVALLQGLLTEGLDALGLADTRVLASARQGRRLRLPGLVLVRQRPGSAKGVVFFTIEDEHGIANLIMYPDIAERFRAAVVAARLIVAEGTVERHDASAVPIVHLLTARVSDRSDLLDGLHLLDEARWQGAMARADEVRHPDYRGQERPRTRMPPSRDFH